ncbi:MAG: DUF2442 domain-containing protein [Pseudomonadota bacterium]
MEIKPIQTREDYDAACKRAYEIYQTNSAPGTPEYHEVDILADAIERYDDEHYPLEEPPGANITKVIPGDDFTLILQFESGEIRFLDMKPLLETETWEDLRDPAMFNTVGIDRVGGLEWDNGLLYDPACAYRDSTEVPLPVLKVLFDVYHDHRRQELDKTGTDR